MAIHDRFYPTPPETFSQLRWRLQLIAEEEVGVKHRQAHANEDAVAARITRVASD